MVPCAESVAGERWADSWDDVAAAPAHSLDMCPPHVALVVLGGWTFGWWLSGGL